MTSDAQAVGLPFTQAIDFFRQKARVPTKRWNDVWRTGHSRGFMVAGATSDALLKDLQNAVARPLEQGTTFKQFQDEFDEIVAKHGWSYTGQLERRNRASVLKAILGDEARVPVEFKRDFAQLAGSYGLDGAKAINAALKADEGFAAFQSEFDALVLKHGLRHFGSLGWRTKIIYETNLSTAYAAGRYAQMTQPAVLEAFPYWQYVHTSCRHPRLQHVAWDGLVLRADDPWWDTHYPPNGWKCGCRVRAVSHGELARSGRDGPDTAPPIQLRKWVDKQGVEHKVPVGIDPGFDYNPGKAWKDGGKDIPLKNVPMKELPGSSTPKSPEKGAPLPELPEALQTFLDDPSGTVDLGTLPKAVQKALGSDVGEVRLSDQTLAKQRAEHKDLDDRHYGLLPELVSDPTVVLAGKDERLLLLRRSGAIWLAVIKTTGAKHENYLVSFRRAQLDEVIKMLGLYDQVYGNADDLGKD